MKKPLPAQPLIIALALGLALGAAPALCKEKTREKLKQNAEEVQPAAPKVKCSAQGSADQDDMCIWVHPTDVSQSAIITSDKKANRIFVYDLEGRTLQSIPARQPGPAAPGI